MKKQAGFTLIELVMVIVILGILGAIAVPKFVDLSTDAEGAAARGMSGAVKAAHAIAIAEIKGFPTITQLAVGDGTTNCSGGPCGPYVQAEGVAAAATGVQVQINGLTCTIPTFTDSNCSTPTSAVGNTVQCVGTITDMSGCS